MNRISAIAASAVLVIAIIASLPAAAKAGDRLRPTLAPFQFMLGSWRCTTWFAAANHAAPHVDAISAHYSVVGGGTAIHQDVVGPDYRSVELFGYEASSRRIVTSAYADDGSVARASSRGWAGNAITLSGSYRRGDAGGVLRDILVKFTQRRFTDTTQVRQRGRWTTVANSQCSKRPGP